MMEILELILNNGNFFAIIACCAMGYYIFYTNQSNRNWIEKILGEHKKEVDNLASVIKDYVVICEKILVALEIQEDGYENK